MAFKKYLANADNTIVNAFQANLTTRGTGANAGEADVLEVFSIYGRQSTSSAELSRVLMNFPISKIKTDRTNGVVPASGSVSFYMRIFNAKTSKTVPKNYKLLVIPVSQSWEEGDGLDLENYRDQTKGGIGSNWLNAASGTTWKSFAGDTIVGGSYKTGSDVPIYSQTFSTGLEDLEVDITGLVEHWIAETIPRYGVGVHLSSSYEAYYSSSFGVGIETGSILDNREGAKKSYYTKRFFARGTQYFFKRPVIEARWDSVTRDDRGDFYYSSSLAPSTYNLNTLYLYNYVRGRLVNIPGLEGGKILVSLYSGSSSPTGSKLVLYDGNTNITGGYVSTGIYSASIAITAAASPLPDLFDVWHSHSASKRTQYFTSSIKPKLNEASNHALEPVYYANLTNLKQSYRSDEKPRLNLYVRNKNWSPNIYTKANANTPNTSIPSASYRVYRLLDAYEAVPYGTGSEFHTGLSYDVSGNYFDFDMSTLEGGYAYAFKFAFYDPELQSWLEQSQAFKFRVESYEY